MRIGFILSWDKSSVGSEPSAGTVACGAPQLDTVGMWTSSTCIGSC